MSDELSTEQRMEAIKGRFKTTIIFFCLGWPVFIGGFAIGDAILRGLGPVLIAVIGMIIMSFPMFGRMQRGGIGALLTVQVTETTTTWSDGSKTARKDSNMLLVLAMYVILLFVGPILTVFYIVILVLRYVTLYFQVQQKPAFARTLFPLLIAGVVVFFGSILVTGLIGNNLRIKTSESQFTVAEIRAMFDEAQKQMFAGSFSYSFERNPGNPDPVTGNRSAYKAAVEYNKADNTTVIEISMFRLSELESYLEAYKNGGNQFVPGRYTFRGNDFAGYVDSESTNHMTELNLSAANADAEAVKKLLPANFFFGSLRDAKDSEFWAQTGGKDVPAGQIRMRVYEEAASFSKVSFDADIDTYRPIRANVQGFVINRFYYGN